MENPVFQDQALVTLSVTNTSRDPDFQKRSVCLTLDKPEVSIGRRSKKREGFDTASNNFYFDCPVMSRHHATIRLDPGKKGIFLKDSGSLHGTFVNKSPILGEDAKQIQNGDRLTFGVDIERGLESFKPYEVEATVKFGDKERQDLPTIYRVPDDTDVEDISSDEGETSISYARNVLKENEIRPAQIPPFQTIDLTPFDNGDDLPHLPQLQSMSFPVPGPKLAPINMNHNYRDNCIDLTLGKWETTRLPEFETPGAESHMTETCETEAHEIETHEGVKAVDPTEPAAGGYSNINDTESLGWDCDNIPSELEDEEEEEIEDDEEEGDDEQGEGSLSDDFSMNSDLDEDLESDNGSIQRDEIEGIEPSSVPYESFFSENDDDELAYLNNLGEASPQSVANEDMTHTLSSVNTGAQVSDNEHYIPPIVAAPVSDLKPSTEISSVREERMDDIAVETTSPSNLILESGPPASGTGKETVLEESSARLENLLNPLPQKMSQVSLQSSGKTEFFEAREENKRIIALGESLPMKGESPTINLEKEYVVETQTQSSVEMRDAETTTDKAVEPLTLAKQPKRKASEISEVDTAVQTQNNLPSGGLVPQETSHSPKRFRKAAEVIGYAAIGGIAVFSALIATAPAL